MKTDGNAEQTALETNPRCYYIVVEEWNYPTESGRNTLDDWDTLEEAMAQCRELAKGEEENFYGNCRLDPLPATDAIGWNGEYEGCIISPKNGLDPFYYLARVVKVARYI